MYFPSLGGGFPSLDPPPESVTLNLKGFEGVEPFLRNGKRKRHFMKVY